MVRLVFLVPFDPIFPHLHNLFSFELSCDGEFSDGVDVGIEVLAVSEILMLLSKYLKDFLLIGLDLCKLTIADEKRIRLVLHFYYFCYNSVIYGQNSS